MITLSACLSACLGWVWLPQTLLTTLWIEGLSCACLSACLSVSVDSGREILRKHFLDPETMIKTQL